MMQTFWMIALLLLAVVLALILPALLRTEKTEEKSASTENLSIFRQQFDELEQDLANNVIDANQYHTAKNELGLRLLDERQTPQTVKYISQPDRLLAVAILLLLPLLAIWLYLKLGSLNSITMPAVSPDEISAQASKGHSAMGGDLEPLLESLKKKLQKDPKNGAGWALLASSYIELGRHTEAVPAFEKAVKLIPDDPQLLANYADALAVINGHNLSGMPEKLVNQALKLDPHHTKALMLAATAAFNKKDYKQAIGYWTQLQKDLPGDSELLPEIKGALAEANALSGIKVDRAGKQKMESFTGISGTVRLAPELANKLDPAATVFIFAREAQGAPIPLAIVRVSARDLPYTYHLDDSNALMPNRKLSQASEIVMLARVSKSSDAKPQTGDLQGVSNTIKPSTEPINFEINQVLP